MNSPSPLKDKLEGLLRQEVSPEQFYRQYFQALSQTLTAAKGFHLWLLQGSQFTPLGGSELGPTNYESEPDQKAFILEMLRECANKQATVIVAAGADRNRSPFALVFTPLLYGKGGGAVQGAQLSWWEVPAGQSLSAQLGQLLDDCGRTAGKMARTQKLEAMSQIADQLQLMTIFLEEVATSADTTSLGLAIVNRTRELTGCDRCALVVVKPGFQLELRAISNVPFPDKKSVFARTLLQIAEHAHKTGLPTAYRKASEKTEEKGDLSDYFFHSRMEEVAVFGIKPTDQQEPIGMLILESTKLGAFEGTVGQTATSLAARSAGPLRRTMDQDALPGLSLMRKVASWKALDDAERKRRLKRFVWIPAAILLGVIFFPVRLEMPGDVRVMPLHKAIAVAEVPGRIVEVLVRDGDRVVAGQVLARMDDSEQRKQMEIALEEEARLQAETDSLQSDADRAASRVSQLSLERAVKEREFYEDQIARASITSPIDGLVMTPGISSRQGDAMNYGTQFALIGNPDSWQLEIHVPEADVAAVLSRLGKGKSVPVRYVLNALPQKRLSAVLTNADAVASVSEVQGGKNLFRIVFALPEDAEGQNFFRAGFTGRAKLMVGYRPLCVAATRRFLNWIRTNVLF